MHRVFLPWHSVCEPGGCCADARTCGMGVGRGAHGPPPRAFARVWEVPPRAFRGKRRVALSPNTVRQTVQPEPKVGVSQLGYNFTNSELRRCAFSRQHSQATGVGSLASAAESCTGAGTDAGAREAMAPRFNVVARLIGELTAGLLDTAADHARIVAAREEVLHAITMGKSLINVEDGRQAAYWQQGDERLSTAEAFHARFSLRRDPLVRASLHAIWEATLRSIQSSDRSGTTLNFDGYKLLFTRVYRVVLDGDDLSDIDASIEEDWETDRKGHDSLTREQLCDSLFELCDHWTTSIDRTEYSQWLDSLLARCSTLMPGTISMDLP